MWIILLTLFFSQQPNGVAQQVMELRGEVNRIDRAGRTITIRSAGVIQEPIYAGPTCRSSRRQWNWWCHGFGWLVRAAAPSWKHSTGWSRMRG